MTVRLNFFILALATSCFVAACRDVQSYMDVPDSLKSREERAEYIALSMAKSINPGDTTIFSSPKFALDFIYIISQMGREKAKACISNMLMTLKPCEDNLSRFQWLLDRYTHDSKSPLYNDEMYVAILEATLESDIDEAFKIRPSYQMTVVNRNRVGSAASDFCYIDNTGNEHRLYDLKSPLTMLLFTRSSCGICKETKKQMTEDTAFRELVGKGCLKVLEIDLDDDSSTKGETKGENWICGKDATGQLKDGKLYEIQYFPCIYLLDDNKRVLLKEADLQRFLNYIKGHR